VSVIPHDLYREVFGENPDRVFHQPYFFLFYGIVTGIVRHLAEQKRLAPIDFVFDYQDGHMTAVTESWKKLLEVIPAEVAEKITGPPTFQRSTSVVALQAADLCVGWSREQADAGWLNEEVRPVPWGDTGGQLKCLGRYWTRNLLVELRSVTQK
jgi:hypothetical protein